MFKMLMTLLIILTEMTFAKDVVSNNLQIADRLSKKGQYEKALQLYENCQSGKKDETNIEKDIFTEMCLIHKARLLFKTSRFDEASEIYDGISKTSYLWPVVLIERAWIAYKKKDYNRTLGLLATYKSPLLQSYYIPEVEVLNALAYFKLCLWDDSFSIIKDFENSEAKGQELKKWLKENHTKKFPLNSITDVESIPFGRTLWLKIHRLPWIKNVDEKRKFFIKLGKFLLSEIERSSQDLFNISLELYTKKKSLIYKKERLISDRYRGDLSHVQRKINQYFWDFQGEFFADELGDYSFGLKSNCETVSKGVENEL